MSRLSVGSPRAAVRRRLAGVAGTALAIGAVVRFGGLAGVRR